MGGLAGGIGCGGLEDFTGWYMEKMFHARGWDYRQKPMNLHGRIWIGNLIAFGLAAVVIVLWVDPLIFWMLSRMPYWILRAVAIAIVLLFAVDYTVSHFLMGIVKKEIDIQPGDNTEEISKNVRQMLSDKALLGSSINAAYPHLQARPKT